MRGTDGLLLMMIQLSRLTYGSRMTGPLPFRLPGQMPRETHIPLYMSGYNKLSMRASFDSVFNPSAQLLFDTGTGISLIHARLLRSAVISDSSETLCFGVKENIIGFKLLGRVVGDFQIVVPTYSSGSVTIVEDNLSVFCDIVGRTYVKSGIVGASPKSAFTNTLGAFYFIPFASAWKNRTLEHKTQRMGYIGYHHLSIPVHLDCQSEWSFVDLPKAANLKHWIVDGLLGVVDTNNSPTSTIDVGTVAIASSEPVRWIIDTGAPMLYLTVPIYNLVIDRISSILSLKLVMEDGVWAWILGDVRSVIHLFPSIVFDFGSFVHVVRPMEYILRDNDQRWFLEISSLHAEEGSFLGMTFLKTLGTLFDKANNRIGFCSLT